MRHALLALALVAAPLAGCTGGDDGDGLDADTERAGWTVRVIQADCSEAPRHVTSDPSRADTDGDGSNDFSEFQAGTDPRDPDTDRDGIKDGPTMTLPEGDERILQWRARGLMETAPGSRTFLGENGFPMEVAGETLTVRTDGRRADSDSCGGIGDGLPDGVEVAGWTVTVGGVERHVTSDPSQPDTDRDGLNDGFEREFGTDPRSLDTDGDGVGDLEDAFPTCDAQFVFKVDRFRLKTNKDAQKVPSGGADLLVVITIAQTTHRYGPVAVPLGESRPTLELVADLPDRGSGLPARGLWSDTVSLEVWDRDDAPDRDDPIVVKNGANGHVLVIQYDAVASRWTGDASNGVAEGTDARMDFTLRTMCE